MVQSTSLSGEYLGRSKWANSSRVRTEIRIVSFVETTPATNVSFFQGEGGHGLSIGSLGGAGWTSRKCPKRVVGHFVIENR